MGINLSPNKNLMYSFIKYLPIILLAIFPLLNLPGFYLHEFIIIYMYIILSTSFNIMAGFTGYVPFGHAAFFGLGAYTTATLAYVLGLDAYSALLTIPLAGIIPMLFAALIGYPTLKLRGVYFAIATLVLNFIIEGIIYNIPWTRGARGIVLPIFPLPIEIIRYIFYYLMFIIAFFSVYTAYKIVKSEFGLVLACIRDDEDAAESIGINTGRYKFYAFLISSFLAGIPGGIYALYMTYIEPGTVFSLYIALNLILMGILGGLGTVIGPILGSVILVTMMETLRFMVASVWYLVIFGILLVFIMIFMPRGIYGLLIEKYPNLKKYLL